MRFKADSLLPQNENEKAALYRILLDMDCAFSTCELERIIENEFFNDNNPIDHDLVDAALARMLQLKGVVLDENNLQEGRVEMMREVFRRIILLSE